MPKKEDKTYSDEEIHAALALAANVGPKPASEHLGVARASIYRWIDRFPELWSDLLAGKSDQRRLRSAEKLDVLADRYTEAEHDALQRAEELIERADGKTTAALIKAMASARGTAVQNSRAIRGEPDEVHKHEINFPQLEKAMQRLLQGGAPLPALPVQNEAENES